MSSVNYNGKQVPLVKSLKSVSGKASAGDQFAVKLKNKRVAIFEKTDKSGFGMWKIKANVPM